MLIYVLFRKAWQPSNINVVSSSLMLQRNKLERFILTTFWGGLMFTRDYPSGSGAAYIATISDD